MSNLSEKEKMARKYCDDTGSMYFDYTDASNELIDAYESAWDHQQKKLQAAEENVALLKEAVEQLQELAPSIASMEYRICADALEKLKEREGEE